jgi:hypothetical protein
LCTLSKAIMYDHSILDDNWLAKGLRVFAQSSYANVVNIPLIKRAIDDVYHLSPLKTSIVDTLAPDNVAEHLAWANRTANNSENESIDKVSETLMKALCLIYAGASEYVQYAISVGQPGYRGPKRVFALPPGEASALGNPREGKIPKGMDFGQEQMDIEEATVRQESQQVKESQQIDIEEATERLICNFTISKESGWKWTKQDRPEGKQVTNAELLKQLSNGYFSDGMIPDEEISALVYINDLDNHERERLLTPPSNEVLEHDIGTVMDYVGTSMFKKYNPSTPFCIQSATEHNTYYVIQQNEEETKVALQLIQNGTEWKCNATVEETNGELDLSQLDINFLLYTTRFPEVEVNVKHKELGLASAEVDIMVVDKPDDSPRLVDLYRGVVDRLLVFRR